MKRTNRSIWLRLGCSLGCLSSLALGLNVSPANASDPNMYIEACGPGCDGGTPPPAGKIQVWAGSVSGQHALGILMTASVYVCWNASAQTYKPCTVGTPGGFWGCDPTNSTTSKILGVAAFVHPPNSGQSPAPDAYGNINDVIMSGLPFGNSCSGNKGKAFCYYSCDCNGTDTVACQSGAACRTTTASGMSPVPSPAVPCP